jgi:hypothetical protein
LGIRTFPELKKGVKNVEPLSKFKSEFKNLKTYRDRYPYQGLYPYQGVSIHATFRQF